MQSLSVIIVTFNSALEVGASLSALTSQSFPYTEICIIDNGSIDASVEVCRSFPGVRVLSNSKNIGYAAACNQGIGETRGDLILFLNPDAIVQNGAVKKLAAAINDLPDTVAGVGPKLILPKKNLGDATMLDSAGIRLSRKTLSPRDRGHGQADHGQYDHGKHYFGPSGACALYRRASLGALKVEDEIFDEDFFVYFEDVDLAWRARLLGYRFVFVPQALVCHDRKNPQHYDRSVQARAFVNRYFCALKNDPELWTYVPKTALIEMLRLAYRTVMEPGFAVALGHLRKHTRGMLRKRTLIQKRRKIDAVSLEAFE